MTEPQGSQPVSHASSAIALKQRLASLSPEKLAAFQKRLQQQERSGCEPVRALPSEAVYPLSFHQQRLWFIEQFQPGTALYNVTRAIRMRGSLNLGALRSALQSLVHRHEALRTTFHMLDGEPVQRINASPELQLPVVNQRAASGASEDAESLLQQRLTAEGRRAFDLSSDLMLRAILYQVADDEHVLQVTIHHLNCDGWSLQLLFNELSVMYRGFCSGQAAELSSLQLRYVDFARWQREPRQRELFAERIQWWKRQLADAPPVLELVTDRPRPQIESGAGAVQPFEIPSDLLAQLQILGREEGATLFMTLLAGFFILLHRYTGMEDFLVGSATAGRIRPETHGIVGFFVDTVVLRADLSGEPTARQVLQRVRRTVIDTVEHGDAPFERIVDSLDLPKDLSRHPLFQVMFNAPPQYSLNLHDLIVSPVNVDLQVSRLDLEMTYSDGANRTTGMTWNTDLFDPETIERMVGHFVTLLEGIVADVDQRLSELPLLTERERQQLLVEWNDTAREYPRDKCVHELFEEQVERSPDAVAVVFQEQEVTYRELNQRANQVAHYLQSREVGPETLVGLCLERSPDLVVGILGILKAGGAYVPLDADYPPPRLQFMLQDAKIDLIVTQQRLLSRLPETNCRFVCLDTDAASFQDASRSNPPVNAGADNLAYVMYTSGSTGPPKGVAIRHTSIARLVFGNDYTTFGPDRVFLQFATVSFDASTFELWGSLLHGAKLVIAPAGLPDLPQLEDLLQRHQVTTLWLTATFFNQVVDHNHQALNGVQEVLAGGAALSVRHIGQAQALLGSTLQLVNGYGPTESTTFTTCYRIPQHLAPELESIPIGRPIANTQVYVLDTQRHLVPIGVPGELYIGGAGLARGYLNRPELTAEKFVPNPFSDHSTSRLYRTGDLCRWRADGNLEFLRRLDHQVKLRGFRIELGEIETVLNEHPSVAQSVVMLREDRPGDKRLVAYCVSAADTALHFPTLRSHLRTRLPDYMLPAVVVSLATLPLTSSGKVDRRALPAPEDSRPELDAGYVTPGNPIEQQLASIWCELLALDRVGVDDDFFGLGGHSLLAVRLFARIEKSFGRKLPLAVLFRHGTIRHLAKLLLELGPAVNIASVLPLHPDGDGRPLFLMPSIGGELLFSRALIEELGGRSPVIGIQPALIAGNLEQFRDFHTTARYFVSTLRTYQPHGPYALAGFSYGGLMAFEVACVLAELGEKVDLLAVIDTGPGHRGFQAQFGDRWRQLLRVVVNLPFWLREEVREFSASRLAGSVTRKLRNFYRWVASSGRKIRELDDVFDVSHIPSQNRELMRIVYAAFRDYVPRQYAGKLTLFRANTRPLLSGSSHDLGWLRFVEALDVRRINGNHETVLHRPHISELARQLGELLDDRAGCLQPTHKQPKVWELMPISTVPINDRF